LYIINFRGAERALIEGRVTDQQAKRHIIAMGRYLLFVAVTTVGLGLIPEAVVALASYKSNGKENFVKRYSVLGFPAMIRCFLIEILYSIPIYIILFILMLLIKHNIISMNFAGYQYFNFAFLIILVCITVSFLRQRVEAIKRVASPETMELPCDNCGAPVGDEDSCCPNCGEKFE